MLVLVSNRQQTMLLDDLFFIILCLLYLKHVTVTMPVIHSHWKHRWINYAHMQMICISVGVCYLAFDITNDTIAGVQSKINVGNASFTQLCTGCAFLC